MRIILAITPAIITTDCTVQEFMFMHRNLGLPWWTMFMPRWFIRGMIERRIMRL